MPEKVADVGTGLLAFGMTVGDKAHLTLAMTESPGERESGLRDWSRTFPAQENSIESVVLCLVIGDICFPIP